MARKPNYGFEKRRKELERKEKQEAKLRRREELAKQPGDEERTDVVNPERTPAEE